MLDRDKFIQALVIYARQLPHGIDARRELFDMVDEALSDLHPPPLALAGKPKTNHKEEIK
jgi:hypothetical protein